MNKIEIPKDLAQLFLTISPSLTNYYACQSCTETAIDDSPEARAALDRLFPEDAPHLPLEKDTLFLGKKGQLFISYEPRILRALLEEIKKELIA